MASKTQDKIYEAFVKIAGGQTDSVHSVIDSGVRITLPGTGTGAQIQTAKPVTWRASNTASPGTASWGTGSSGMASGSTGASTAQSVASSILQNLFSMSPLAGVASAGSSSGGGGGIGDTIESIASTVLKSGLGMVPLIGGLLSLFGGDDAPAAPVLTKYAMPDSIAFESANLGVGYGVADYDQMALPRVLANGSGGQRPSNSPISSSAGNATSGGMSPYANAGSSVTAPAPQITVNVQAMDARSFLDRSGDIAAAVREAMLNMSSINDVVSEL